jgi:hypothetical protein
VNKREKLFWAMTNTLGWLVTIGSWLFVALMVLTVVNRAHAGEFITELGGGYKDFPSTSFLMTSDCQKAIVTNPEWPTNPRPGQEWSCGGDNPVFVGWPIAYEWTLTRGNRVRLGHFHLSQWFDNQGEVHLDCLCASFTFRWSRLRDR